MWVSGGHRYRGRETADEEYGGWGEARLSLRIETALTLPIL